MQVRNKNLSTYSTSVDYTCLDKIMLVYNMKNWGLEEGHKPDEAQLDCC